MVSVMNGNQDADVNRAWQSKKTYYLSLHGMSTQFISSSIIWGIKMMSIYRYIYTRCVPVPGAPRLWCHVLRSRHAAANCRPQRSCAIHTGSDLRLAAAPRDRWMWCHRWGGPGAVAALERSGDQRWTFSLFSTLPDQQRVFLRKLMTPLINRVVLNSLGAILSVIWLIPAEYGYQSDWLSLPFPNTEGGMSSLSDTLTHYNFFEANCVFFIIFSSSIFTYTWLPICVFPVANIAQLYYTV